MWRFLALHEAKMTCDPIHLKHEGEGFFTSRCYPGIWRVYSNNDHFYVTRFIDLTEETSIWSEDGNFVSLYLAV